MISKAPKHLLRIHEADGIRTIRLHQNNYLIGRDKYNDIVLFSKTVSRCHAHLIRIPTSRPAEVCYRILDGDTTGKLSTNGIAVNDLSCKIHDLSNGDTITIGAVTISYCIEMILPFHQTQLSAAANLQQVEDLSATCNPKVTLVKHDIPEKPQTDETPEDWEDDLPATTLFRR